MSSRILVRPVATRREWLMVVLLTAALAPLLAGGFISTAREVYRLVTRILIAVPQTQSFLEGGERIAFPLLAGLFLRSLPAPRPPRTYPDRDWLAWLEMCVVPILIAVLFGLLRGVPSLFMFLDNWDERLDLLWYLILIPIGEEWLFRGWYYELVDRVWPQWGSATNPLPLAVWSSALAFSLWHAQNVVRDPMRQVVFQMLYTFLTGI
jgi:membrane protease YdiL (CAAX protease family)